MSSDSDDIDLEEIAKMIDPLEDLEENLFSSKPKKLISPRKNLSAGGNSEVRKNLEEMEVLSSMSSGNGQPNLQTKESDLGSWLKNHQDQNRENVKDMQSYFSNFSRRANISGLESTDIPERDTDGHSDYNLKTGLWSGDNLWNIDDENDDKTPQPHRASPIISPVKSSRDVDLTEESEYVRIPVNSAPKLSRNNVRQNASSWKLQSNDRMSSSTKKSGKFDWLGLVDDDSDDEKNEVLKNSEKEVSAELFTNAQMEGQEKSYMSEVPMKEVKSNAIIEGTSQFKRKEHDRENVIFSKKIDSVTDKKGDMTRGDGVGLAEKERNPTNFMSKDNLAEGLSSPGLKNVLSEEGEIQMGLNMEKITDKQNNNKRGSISEENEGISVHGYAPTFLGGNSESSARRRRRQSKESISVKGNVSTIFDPLGLFLLDDKDKFDETTKEKKSLPSWLTGAPSISTNDKKDDSLFIQDEVRVTEESHNKKDDTSLIHDEIKMDKSDDRKNNSLIVQNEVETVRGVEDMSSSVDVEANKVDKPFPSVSNSVKDYKPGYSKQSKKGLLDVPINGSQKKLIDVSNKIYIDFPREKSIENEIKRGVQKGENMEPEEKTVSQKKESLPEHKLDHLENSLDENSDEEGIVLPNDGKLDDYDSDNESRRFSGEEQRSDSEIDLVEETEERNVVEKGTKEVNLESFRKMKGHHRGSEIETRDDSFSDLRKTKEAIIRRKPTEEYEGEVRKSHVLNMRRKCLVLEGEIEHLKIVIASLKMDKYKSETLLSEERARHTEQMKTLEEIHRNEISTWREALIREEQRSKEEVTRLVEDHKKTLDRVMEANARLDEDFRTRMMEARRDWSRDVEAMRLAYQQSSSTALNNASLAVLTGHRLDFRDGKENSEVEKKRDPPVISLHSEEVKRLTQTVEKLDTILEKTLEVIVSKNKSLSEGNTNTETIGPNDIKDKFPRPSRINRRTVNKFRTKGKFKRDRAIQNKCHRPIRKISFNEEYGEGSLESEDSGDSGITRSGKPDTEEVKSKTKNTDKQSPNECPWCSRCKKCGRETEPKRTFQREYHIDKEKSGKEDFVEDSSNIKTNSDRSWETRSKDEHHPLSIGRVKLSDGSFIPKVYFRKHPGIIINPREYIMKLASENLNDIF